MTSNPTMRADAGPPAWPCGERGQGQHAMELQKRATWQKSIRTPRTFRSNRQSVLTNTSKYCYRTIKDNVLVLGYKLCALVGSCRKD